MKEIRITPVSGPEHTLWSFYFGLNELDSMAQDCKQVAPLNAAFPYERVMPLIS